MADQIQQTSHSLPASLRDVMDCYEANATELEALISRTTGEVVVIDTTLSDRGADMPDWQKDAVVEAERVANDDSFIRLPDSYDFHEYRVMESFCADIENQKIQEELFRAISGKGAFSRFKDTIHRHDIADNWYAWRNAALKKFIISFLEDESIPFTDDAPAPKT